MKVKNINVIIKYFGNSLNLNLSTLITKKKAYKENIEDTSVILPKTPAPPPPENVSSLEIINKGIPLVRKIMISDNRYINEKK